MKIGIDICLDVKQREKFENIRSKQRKKNVEKSGPFSTTGKLNELTRHALTYYLFPDIRLQFTYRSILKKLSIRNFMFSICCKTW